nr:MAG TPA: hypothetical protein [Bacteriophage sp.]
MKEAISFAMSRVVLPIAVNVISYVITTRL